MKLLLCRFAKEMRRTQARKRIGTSTGNVAMAAQQAEAEQNPEDAVGTRLAHSGPR